jgi:hypothetical protein
LYWRASSKNESEDPQAEVFSKQTLSKARVDKGQKKVVERKTKAIAKPDNSDYD